MKRQGKRIFTSSVHRLGRILLHDHRALVAGTQDRVEGVGNLVVVRDDKVCRCHRTGREEVVGSRHHTDRRSVPWVVGEGHDSHPWDGEGEICIVLCHRNSLDEGFGYDIHRAVRRVGDCILWEAGRDDHSHRKVASHMVVFPETWTGHDLLMAPHSVSVRR